MTFLQPAPFLLLLGAARTNCYIVYLPETKKAVIIDPADDAERIQRVIQDLDCNRRNPLLACAAINRNNIHFVFCKDFCNIKQDSASVMSKYIDFSKVKLISLVL